jgi:hypothetical protein
MTHFVGLDISMKETKLHVLDEAGNRVWRGRCATEPAHQCHRHGVAGNATYVGGGNANDHWRPNPISKSNAKWPAQHLANQAKLSVQTIKRFEASDEIPPSRSSTLRYVKVALESAGIESTGSPTDRPGTRLAAAPRKAQKRETDQHP